ncbi:MAG TPA: type II toxin-antitoxin system death-on-curing family toxin [Candidatus Saccharimonadales bacterium]|jgi:death-on-curing protein|nr:type II toxin-antitoxin system death-on-curing family toxin [Candidatus Saccharimonadales bacterium]
MRLVSLIQIVAIHDRIIKDIGGSLGIREPGLLAAIAEKPAASFGGKDLYPTIYDKAAALFEALVNYHAFVDGNKRTAIATLEYFLHLNNLVLVASAKEKERFTLHTATTNPDLTEVAAWLQTRTRRI